VPDFSLFNETDVREEILSPLLRSLGYFKEGPNRIDREHPVRYGRDQLGRKKGDRDPLLRGRIDYVLTAGDRIRWVVEAKAPSVDITIEEVAQAFTYARHPEVAAVLYAICNGKNFNLYRTDYAPENALVLELDYERYADPSVGQLEGILSPQALLASYPDIVFVPGAALGPGLRSVERVTGGVIEYYDEKSPIPVMNEMQIIVVSGDVQREGAEIVASLLTRAPVQAIQEVLEKLGVAEIEVRSKDANISEDAANRTKFTYSGTLIFPIGTELLDLISWTKKTLEKDVRVSVEWVASVFLDGRDVVGQIQNRLIFEDLPAIDLWGNVRLTLG